MKKILKEEVLILRKKGFSYQEIRKKLGCTLSVISYHCKNAELDNPNINKKPTEEEIKSFNNLYNEGKTCKEIGEIYNFGRHTVSKYIVGKKVRKRKISDSKSVVNWRKKVKEKLVEYKGGKCTKCGYNKCVEVLQFHHTNPKEKDFTISGKSWAFEKLKKETDKCILLCANCHIEEHNNSY